MSSPGWHNAVRGTSYRHPARLDGQWNVSWTFCKRFGHLAEQWNAQVGSRATRRIFASRRIVEQFVEGQLYPNSMRDSTVYGMLGNSIVRIIRLRHRAARRFRFRLARFFSQVSPTIIHLWGSFYLRSTRSTNFDF